MIKTEMVISSSKQRNCDVFGGLLLFFFVIVIVIVARTKNEQGL
jgi:hypothetical protein